MPPNTQTLDTALEYWLWEAACSIRGPLDSVGWRDWRNFPSRHRHLNPLHPSYIVCHELARLKIPGHGKGWQALMGIHLPDWREWEERLAEWV